MTLFGAIIASVETAELLAEKFDLEADEDALAYYQGLFFEDYSLKREKDQFSIELIPTDENGLSNLEFVWELEMDGETVAEIEDVGLNAAVFTLPKTDADYDLRVFINPLSDGFSLRGGFYVPNE